MAAPPPPPPPRMGLSLYDNLLDPNDPKSSSNATISSAPVLYNQPEAEAKKPLDPILRFQPIRRPQVNKPKLKGAFPKAAPKPAASLAAPSAPVAPVKSTLADWAATEEDEWRYGTGERRERGGRKKKKKKQQNVQAETDWDELYDPTRPTNVEEYLRSDEKIDEIREWKDLLYRSRRRQEESDISDDDEDEARHTSSTQFAPPPSYEFAPPSEAPPPPPPPPPESLPPIQPDDSTGDDAYARRLTLTAQHSPPPPPPPQQPQDEPPPPPPPTAATSVTISRAPVRYTQPEVEMKDDDGYSPPPVDNSPETDEPQGRSSRPGQAGFAQRLMNRYGWQEGSGLGADESGIVNPLRVQVEKRRKKADADGGGWAEPGGKGKIIGGKRKEEAGKFGVMSEVIVLRNMLENMPDLQSEIEQGLGQEIGEECGEKYGRVERLYIDQERRQVFIKFTNQVSALRAVNELDGRVFNGNAIVSRFYETEKFDSGRYS
ncbi:hypothetical protein B0I35DRAFT_405264 [Stachybotrys elegans]|uniref:G-patch domain-containing protein n=1 Tax=Stachybotrys elegans TaxID=80388 RepID=A0A8K0WUS9_9HYPO|nr:hypothetical protein B0I35DRAFT_405264 [Stachybotrys elegans]